MPAMTSPPKDHYQTSSIRVGYMPNLENRFNFESGGHRRQVGVHILTELDEQKIDPRQQNSNYYYIHEHIEGRIRINAIT